MRKLLKGSVPLLFLLFFGACSTGNRTFPKTNVILISIDTLRADRLPLYGYEEIETPALDSFAADGIVFDKAYSQCPLTFPSHATILTGLRPTEHGVRDNLSYRFERGMETIATVLKREGYRTSGFVSSMVLGKRTGICGDFDIYDSDMIIDGEVYPERSGTETIARATRWLETRDQTPFFLFLHLYEPHAPYEPPEPFRSLYEDPYDGEIAHVDRLLGNFFQYLKKLGVYDDSLIVLLSDHGEGLGDHGEDEHGIFLYREVLHVPLIFKLPGNAHSGERNSRVCGLVDIKPTVLSLFGMDPGATDGEALFGASQDSNRMIYSESYYPRNGFGYSPLRSVIRRDDHYIRSNRLELFEMSMDPRETRNLVPGKQVPEAFDLFLQTIGEGRDIKGEDSAEDLELLASLGYTAVAGTAVNREETDLSELVRDLKQLKNAKELLDQGAVAASERTFRALLERNPCMHEGRLRLSNILADRGDDLGLEALYEEGLRCDPGNIPFLMLLVRLKLKLKKDGEAAALTQFVWEKGPVFAKDELAFYYFTFGKREAAINLAEKVLAEHKDVGFSAFVMGVDHLEARHLDDAIAALSGAAKFFYDHQDLEMAALSYHYLGDANQKSGNPEAAVEFFKKALQMKADLRDTRVALALLFGSLKKPMEAIKTMDEWVAEFPTQQNYHTASQTMKKLGLEEPASFYENQSQQFD